MRPVWRDPDRTAALLDLLAQSKKPGWWTQYDIPADLGLYLALEQDADTTRRRGVTLGVPAGAWQRFTAGLKS